MGINRFYTPNHKIQRSASSQDTHGGLTESWSDHLTLSGKLWQLSGDKMLSQDKITVFADHRFACDLADITEKDRYLDPNANPYTIKLVTKRQRPDNTGHMELSLERAK